MGFVVPPALAPGDLVAVVAPSSPFPAREFWTGLAWLRGRYTLRASTGMLARTGYLAGDDTRRTEELASALRDPRVKAVVTARGGYGTTRIVGALPWDDLVARPKWFVGFSDATAIHLEANARGVATVHGPNVTGLGGAHPADRLAWMRALEAPSAPFAWTGLRVLEGGEACGPIVGGNLALLVATAAAGRLALPEGCVLALEDVTERPYRVDRMLTALLSGGHLGRACALVFGGFEQCDPGPDGVTVEEVLHERTRRLGVPVVAGAPFGHGAPNRAFVTGRTVIVANGGVTSAGQSLQ